MRNFKITAKPRLLLALCGIFASLSLVWAGVDRPSHFTNTGSIINTRHNMSMLSASGVSLLENGKLYGETYTIMDTYRNQYREVCVYCHTPHGADAAVEAPLWNRKLPTSTVYTTYNQLNTTTLTQTVEQPGAASLPCLSCHDGQQAVDAVRNMPGSGKYQANPDNAFLNTWDPSDPSIHMGLLPGDQNCLACHSTVGYGPSIGWKATDFTVAYIGTDLRNDHPVGVAFPSTNGTGTDWKTPNGTKVVAGRTNKFFDDTPNGRMDKNEIRLYDSGNGNGASVECASCHDPHGVPSGGSGSTFFPTFMRKSNSGSGVCLTCHAK